MPTPDHDAFKNTSILQTWLRFFWQSRLRLLETELENDELAQYILDLFKAKDTFHTCAMWYFKLLGWSICFPLLSEQSWNNATTCLVYWTLGEKRRVQPPHPSTDWGCTLEDPVSYLGHSCVILLKSQGPRNPSLRLSIFLATARTLKWLACWVWMRWETCFTRRIGNHGVTKTFLEPNATI